MLKLHILWGYKKNYMKRLKTGGNTCAHCQRQRCQYVDVADSHGMVGTHDMPETGPKQCQGNELRWI